MASVLIVEDDLSTRMAVTEMLEVLGQEEVRDASNGADALERIREELPQVMFLDLMMPVMDGFEVLRNLRNGSAPRPGHIIVMSAHANKEDRAGVMQLGADQFLSKPFTLEQLENALKIAIS